MFQQSVSFLKSLYTTFSFKPHAFAKSFKKDCVPHIDIPNNVLLYLYP